MSQKSIPELPDLEYGNLTAFLQGAARWIDLTLPQFIPAEKPGPYLYDLARDYPARGGKRFRPALLLLCAALTGADPRKALPTAVALELFQNFALVHDDIEDGSWTRRGKPALHRLHGVPLALNAGDLMFSLVHETLLDNHDLLGSGPALEIARLCNQVFRRTFEGQALDIGWIRDHHLPTRMEYEEMIRLKTGWYSGRGPCQLGAMIGSADDPVLQALGDFGERLGIGFQVRDDLLNLTADSEQDAPQAGGGGYGKEHGGDIAEGKRTLIVIEMMERLPAGDGERLRAILDRMPEETESGDVRWAIEQARRSGALDAVRSHCAGMGNQARACLEPLPESPQKSLLMGLAEYLIMERNI